jgi:predicted patatin/cPLA2 family phospholipase
MKNYMHPVVEHILARKGKNVPIEDGRKIALVHFGGVMTGVRGAGALTALQELGLTHAFDSIYGTSAGFANACYFLTGDMRVGASTYYEDLTSKEFLNLERVWDVVNIDYLLEVLRTKKPIDYSLLSESKTKLYARLWNTLENKTGYKLVNGMTPAGIESVVHAAVSLPYLNPGSIEIEGAEYKDAGYRDIEAESVLNDMLDSDATDILVLYNYYESYEFLRDAGLVDTKRIYQIVPYKEENLSRISTDHKALKSAAQHMGDMVKSIFGSDEPIRLI